MDAAMARSNAMMQRVIDAWVTANNGLLYENKEHECYIVEFDDQDIRTNEFNSLFELALYNNNEAVKSLRKQGVSDEDIKAHGFLLPEDIEEKV